jgi:hypothetical protein
MAVAGGGFEQSLITPLQSPETKRNSVERTMQRRYQSLQLHDAISRRYVFSLWTAFRDVM